MICNFRQLYPISFIGLFSKAFRDEILVSFFDKCCCLLPVEATKRWRWWRSGFFPPWLIGIGGGVLEPQPFVTRQLRDEWQFSGARFVTTPNLLTIYGCILLQFLDSRSLVLSYGAMGAMCYEVRPSHGVHASWGWWKIVCAQVDSHYPHHEHRQFSMQHAVFFFLLYCFNFQWQLNVPYFESVISREKCTYPISITRNQKMSIAQNAVGVPANLDKI